MKNVKYRPRVIDSILERRLTSKGAILIEGLKWCGKTTTAEKFAKSILYMSEVGKMEQNINLSIINPNMLLNGLTPRLIDEWQIAPRLWDGIRFNVDHREGLGQYILTGSSVPADKSEIFHSGTGRFAWIKMRTMSLWESGDSSGDISLQTLFEKPTIIEGYSSKELGDIAFLTCRGGWPSAIEMNPNDALEQAFDYINAVEYQDISRVDGIKRNANFTHRILRSYARHQGCQVNYSAICQDLFKNEGSSITENTIASYVNALKMIFVIEDSESWNPNLRSKSAIRTSDTRYFTDPSIATAVLGLGPNDLINDLKTFGLIFETMAIRDLRVYSEKLFGKVYHYRDKNGLECDAVIHLRNGSYALVEIKLGGDILIEEGVKTLKSLANKIDTNKMKEPSFLMVLTAVGQYAYRREDGIYVVPITCLKD